MQKLQGICRIPAGFLAYRFTVCKKGLNSLLNVLPGGVSESAVLCSTNLQLFVKTAWATQGRIQSVGPVCGPQHQQLAGMTLLGKKRYPEEVILQCSSVGGICRNMEVGLTVTLFNIIELQL